MRTKVRLRLPIADTPLLAPATRRVRLVRSVVTAVLAVLVGSAIVLAARGRAPAAAAPPPTGRTTEVVLDVSGSVGGSTLAPAARALARLGHGRHSVGLVLFSDTAEQALPPGTPPSQLLPFARALAPSRTGPTKESLPPAQANANPWAPSFTGGTQISTGVNAARQALVRSHARGQILLITDLGDDPQDHPAMKRALLALAQAGIPLHVFVLPNALGIDRAWFRTLEGPGAIESRLPAPPVHRIPAAQAGFPLPLVVAAVLLAAALGAYELLGVSMRWGGGE